MTSSAPALSLADLERHDPGARPGGTERRFMCPLPGPCAGKSVSADHRTFCLNTRTGAWYCQRCHAEGLLTDFREDRPYVPRQERARQALRRHTELPPPCPHTTPDAASAPPEAGQDPTQEAQDRKKLTEILGKVGPLRGTPGEAFLTRRGVSPELAAAAKARYTSDMYGRPAVVFPIRNAAGDLVAVHGRHTDGRTDPKAHTCGPLGTGVFWTSEEVRQADTIAIAEAPIDALSLAAAGLPAIALCGTSLRVWLPLPFAWKRVLLAFDADDAGDHAAQEWTAALRYGTFCPRLRPEGAKDWNELLQRAGPEPIRAAIAAALDILPPLVAPPSEFAPTMPADSEDPAPACPEPSLFAPIATDEATPAPHAPTPCRGKCGELVTDGEYCPECDPFGWV